MFPFIFPICSTTSSRWLNVLKYFPTTCLSKFGFRKIALLRNQDQQICFTVQHMCQYLLCLTIICYCVCAITLKNFSPVAIQGNHRKIMVTTNLKIKLIVSVLNIVSLWCKENTLSWRTCLWPYAITLPISDGGFLEYHLWFSFSSVPHPGMLHAQTRAAMLLLNVRSSPFREAEILACLSDIFSLPRLHIKVSAAK